MKIHQFIQNFVSVTTRHDDAITMQFLKVRCETESRGERLDPQKDSP
jgi:hypothetical protein